MLNWIEGENVRSIVSDHARLDFRWTGDRWDHAIRLGDGAETPAVLLSQEAGADHSSGPMLSPALQELHVQRDPGAPGTIQALLVGKSGAHHFSAVFSVRDEGGHFECAVEVADRCKARQDRVSSTYLVDLPAGNLLDAGPSSIRWELPAEIGGSLLLSCSSPTRLDLHQFGRRGTHVQASPTGEDRPPTLLWNYSWSISRPS